MPIATLRICATLTAVFFLAACEPRYSWNGSLYDLLMSQPERFATVMRDPERHRVQIIYTQIDRDADNAPSFQTYTFRLDAGEYFYPASTVKLPTALLALEKLRTLDIAGLGVDTSMLTDTASQYQLPATSDKTAPTGLPSIGHYVRKILLVSDNDAFNRLYEFLGQDALNKALRQRGLIGTRIVHRLELPLSVQENRLSNPIDFVEGDRIVYSQASLAATGNWLGEEPLFLGEAEVVDGVLLQRPKDFSEKNAFPLQDQLSVLRALIFPASVDPQMRFNLAEEDYDLVYRNMSVYPAESGIDAYDNSEKYPEGYVKFLMFGGTAQDIPDHIRIFNKVGDAYGFLTDTAYIVDLDNNIEFFLAATVYTNANGIFNDNNYEYDEIGLPFLKNLGTAIYELELHRTRQHVPDLSRFGFERP